MSKNHLVVINTTTRFQLPLLRPRINSMHSLNVSISMEIDMHEIVHCVA